MITSDGLDTTQLPSISGDLVLRAYLEGEDREIAIVQGVNFKPVLQKIVMNNDLEGAIEFFDELAKSPGHADPAIDELMDAFPFDDTDDERVTNIHNAMESLASLGVNIELTAHIGTDDLESQRDWLVELAKPILEVKKSETALMKDNPGKTPDSGETPAL